MGVVMALSVCSFTALAAETIHVDELSELTSAVNGEGTDIEIVLDSNITLEDVLTIPNDKNVTIDLNGKKLTGASDKYLIQFGSFDAGEEDNFEKCTYKNDGELIIENGKIDCYSAVLNYFGDVTFGDDLTIDAENRGITTYGGEVTVDGAEMTADGYGILTFNSFHAFFSTQDSRGQYGQR